MKDTVQADTFATLRAQLAGLAQAEQTQVTAGHLDLGPDIWLSADPAGRAEMICQPSEGGVVLHLREGDSGDWACLGMRFPPAALAGARFLGLLVALRGGDVVSFMPTLRYLHEAGVRDVPAAAPVTLVGGAREHIAHIPIDHADMENATGCELNLFFLRDRFVAEFEKIEPLLIL